jgi:hypothetical protein
VVAARRARLTFVQYLRPYGARTAAVSGYTSEEMAVALVEAQPRVATLDAVAEIIYSVDTFWIS